MGTSKTRSQRVRVLTECAILIALATILSFVVIYKLPYGGSVTAASMLPMILIAYRHGIGAGLGAGLVYGVIQQLFGLGNLSYATSWRAAVAIILLDYIVAFAVTGLGGIFRRKNGSAVTAVACGGLLVCILRYACHVLSGATVWAGISIPTKAALLYSFSYNATYMLPETVVLLVVAVYLASVLDIGADIPVRLKKGAGDPLLAVLPPIGGLALVGAVIFDAVSILPKLQNPDGEFDITLAESINYTPAIIVTSIAVAIALICAVTVIVRRRRVKE